jgi:hypothetical protein
MPVSTEKATAYLTVVAAAGQFQRSKAAAANGACGRAERRSLKTPNTA